METKNMDMWIIGAKIITPHQTITDSIVMTKDGRIAAIEKRDQVTEQPQDVKIIQANGYFVVPGFIDLHVHGGAGSETMDAEPSAIQQMSSFFLSHGVTAWLPTTISNSPEAILKAIENIINVQPKVKSSQILGVHLEGPYLNRSFCGAQPAKWLRTPEKAEYRRWFSSGAIRRITVAPEIPGVMEMIEEGVRYGISFSAGHTQANYTQIEEAVDLGLNQITHMFNGMPGLNHREPGIVGAALVDDRIYCEIIADGHHVNPVVLKLLFRLKGAERILLITDAIRAAGMIDGDYDLGGQTITVQDGVARTSDGGLAGSTITLDQAVRNMINFTEVTINQAITMVTSTPASILGLGDCKGTIRPGADADLVIMDRDINVKAVIVAGEIVYQSTEFQQEVN